MTYAHHLARLATPIGIITLTDDGRLLTAVTITPGEGEELAAPSGSPAAEAARQLRQWFAGERWRQPPPREERC